MLNQLSIRTRLAILAIMASLALLVLGAQWLVDAAVVFARALGVTAEWLQDGHGPRGGGQLVDGTGD